MSKPAARGVRMLLVVAALAVTGCSNGQRAASGSDGRTVASAAIGESTLHRLTQMARHTARELGDPSVHNAELVVTTRRRMNHWLGIGYQPSQDQTAKVFVIQVRGRFTCNDCSHPPGVEAPSGAAAQLVLSFGSLAETDFGLTPHPAILQRMGPVMRLSW